MANEIDPQRPSYIQDKTPKLNKKINTQTTKLQRGIKNLGKAIRNANNVTRAFKKAANKKAPIRGQIASAANTFSDIADPSVRSQLIRQATNQIKANRQQDLAMAQQDVANRINAMQTNVNNRSALLTNLLNRRQQARDLTSKEYFNALNAQTKLQVDAESRANAMQSMINRKAAGLEFFGDAVGQNLRGSNSVRFFTGPDGQLYAGDAQSGAVQPVTNPDTGEYVEETDPFEEAFGTGN